MSTVIGVFESPVDVVAIVERLKGRGFDDLETYSPAPFAEVDDAMIPKPSGVRLYTLIGGLVGVVTGYALTIWMANDWQIMVGGTRPATFQPTTPCRCTSRSRSAPPCPPRRS